MTSHYSLEIVWSDEDQCFVVYIPEFRGLVKQPCTDGATYEEAAKHGQEVIESMVEIWAGQEGMKLPAPRTSRKTAA